MRLVMLISREMLSKKQLTGDEEIERLDDDVARKITGKLE